MIVEITEVITFAIEVPVEASDPEEFAEQIYLSSDNPFNDFEFDVHERITEYRE